MNLVSRKMVIEELKDKFLVRRTRMEVGKLGKPYPLLNLHMWEYKTRSVASGIFFCANAKRPSVRMAFRII
ncbi:hypothetical protein FVB21_06675 [Escherichia coli]|nr:hypothetical protein [Escherichia coli]